MGHYVNRRTAKGEKWGRKGEKERSVVVSGVAFDAGFRSEKEMGMLGGERV